jgi:hypothetical protein
MQNQFASNVKVDATTVVDTVEIAVAAANVVAAVTVVDAAVAAVDTVANARVEKTVVVQTTVAHAVRVTNQ